MSIINKILLILAGIVISGLLIFVVYLEITRTKKLEAIENSVVEQKQLLDNISRAQAQYASRDDIEVFAKNRNIDLDVIKKDLENLHAEIKGINAITINSKGQVSGNLPSTSIVPRPDPPQINIEQNPYGYLTNKQELVLTEKFSNIDVPFGKVGFSAWQEKPWDINIAPRRYMITSVLGQNDDGRHFVYSKLAIISNSKTYDIKIDDNKFLEEYPSNKFSWFNPRLSLFINGGVNITNSPLRSKMTPGIGVSLMSWGKTKPNPTFSILNIGVGPGFSYGNNSTTIEFTLAPIQYNIGSSGNVPLIKNTFIGPTVQINTLGEITPGIGLSVGL